MAATREQHADLDFLGTARIVGLPDATDPQHPATKAQLDLKAPLASPTFTGTVTVPDGSFVYAKLATSAIAAAGNYAAATASKLLSAAGVWADAAIFALTDAATIGINMANFVALAGCALAGNRTLGNPTNTKVGQFFCWRFTATTSARTVALGANFYPEDNVEAFPISIATTETVYVCGFVEDSTHIRITAVLRF